MRRSLSALLSVDFKSAFSIKSTTSARVDENKKKILIFLRMRAAKINCKECEFESFYRDWIGVDLKMMTHTCSTGLLKVL